MRLLKTIISKNLKTKTDFEVAYNEMKQEILE